MPCVFSREQVRQVDQIAIQDYGMSGLVLMENAARGVVDVLVSQFAPAPVIILCGRGNNAGDGYAIARHLDNREWPVTIAQLSPSSQLSGDALVNWNIAQACGIAIEHLENRTAESLQSWLRCSLLENCLVLDGMLGTGAIGKPRFPFDEAVRTANQLPVRRIAIDNPTGLDCDTGLAAECCFKAELTCTFVAMKPGFSNVAAAPYVGDVRVIDIGVPRRLVQQLARKNDVTDQP